MDVALHLRVIWRFKGVLLAGVLVGIAAAVLAAYEVSFDGRPKLTPRGAEEWTSRSELLVTQRGFPWGRVTLPGATAPGEPTLAPAPPRTGDGSKLQYADPGRFATLASLYSVISFSDQARARLPEPVEPEQIQAVPRSLDETSGIVLPVVVILTKHDTKAKARELNVHTVAALRDLLREQQLRAQIPPNERVSLQTLNFPSVPVKAVGRSLARPILAFVLSLICAIAWTHILHNLGGLSGPFARGRRAGAAPQRPQSTAKPETASILVDPERAGGATHRSVAPPRTTN